MLMLCSTTVPNGCYVLNATQTLTQRIVFQITVRFIVTTSAVSFIEIFIILSYVHQIGGPSHQ